MTHGHKDWQGFEGFPGWENIRMQFNNRRGPGGKGGWDNFGEVISGFVNEALSGAMRQGGGPGGKGGRMFDGGELRLVLLKLIEDGPRHGYDLIRAVEEMTGGAYAPSPGIVYPTLTMLADMEYIAEQESAGARKVFEITDAGREHLAEREEEVDALMARLNGVGAMRQRVGRGPVRRAIQNVKSAIHGRMGMGDETGDLAHKIADILDEAARKIERLP